MANNKNFIAKNGVSTGDGYAMPDVRPSLLLDFANSKTLDPRITFTRGSTATYWDGKTTTKAEENLTERSENFANAYWTKSDVTVTEGATAPDGSTTAATVQSAVSSDPTQAVYHLMSPVPQVGATVSVYAKEGTTEFFSLQAATSNPCALFNLNTGTVLHQTGCTATITDVGNGWYRCALENLTVSGNYIMMSPVGSDIGTGDAWGNNDAQAGDNVLIWGVQLENNSSPTAYTATGGAPIVKYQPTLQTAASGEARFDHNPTTGESKGLLIEEARTNLFTYSVDYSHSNWNRNNSEVDDNVIIAPDGTLTGGLLKENTASGSNQHNMSQAPTVTTQHYTMSAYFKEPTIHSRRYVGFTMHGMAYAGFDIQAGTTFNYGSGLTNQTITDVGNGWYYCTATWLKTNTNAGAYIILLTGGSNSHNYEVDGTKKGMHIWGAQLEAGSFPTSYIPTSGSTVTRSNDDAEITDISFVNPTELTVYFESEQTANNNWRRYFAFGDNTDGTMEYAIFSNPTNNISSYVRVNDVNQASFSNGGQIAEGVAIRGAMSIAEGKVAMSINGAATSTDTSVNLAGVNLTRLRIGRGEENLSLRFSDKPIKKLAVYPKVLSDATLQAMTTE